MRFSVAALVLASAGYAAAQSCPDQTVIDACIASTKAALSECSDRDKDCTCSAWTAVVACYNNCPDNVDLPAAEAQATANCDKAPHPSSAAAAATTPVIGSISASVSSSLALVSSSLESRVSSASGAASSEIASASGALDSFVSSATSRGSAAASSALASASSLASDAAASGSEALASATGTVASSPSNAARKVEAGSFLALVGAGVALAM